MTTIGTVYCWGDARYLGVDTGTSYGSASGQMSVVPAVGLGGGAIAVAASKTLYHSCALMGGPLRVQCWGEGDSGQLGRGSTADVGCGASPYCDGSGGGTFMNATAPIPF
jgi:hypothetical protein